MPESMPVARLRAFLEEEHFETPFLVVDLNVVLARYFELAESLPESDRVFAVKANPATPSSNCSLISVHRLMWRARRKWARAWRPVPTRRGCRTATR